MSGENPQTVVVNPPSQSGQQGNGSGQPPIETAINQAEQFGAMRERFLSTEAEVVRMRSEVEDSRQSREALHERLSRLEEGQNRLLRELEEESEEETAETEALSTGTTVIVPPALETPPQEEPKPKPKQSWANRLLFGREDE